MDKHVVMVSRMWDNPNIAISVTDTSIDLSVALPDFINSLAKEVGNPTMLFSQAAMLAKLKESAEKVVSQMKAESARVM